MDEFGQFLSKMKAACRDTALMESVESIYNAVFETSLHFRPIPPDSMHSTAVMQTGTGIKCPVANSSGSVGGPNVAGAYKYSPALAGPSRDMHEETQEAFSQKVKFPELQAYTTVPIKELMERSPANDVGGVAMDPSVMAKEANVGFTIKAGFGGNRGTINGVDASGGGGGASAAGAPSA